MPTIQRIFTLEVAPEKYVDSCTEAELQAVMLLASARLEILQAPAPAPQAAAPSGRGKRVWTKERLQQLSTMSAAEAAERFGVTITAVHSQRSRLGLTRPRKRREGEDYDVNDNGALTGVLL
jgi:hypothetical protein